ncbi:MAG: PPC domain-containing protein [Planctomycetaceae bacterium]
MSGKLAIASLLSRGVQTSVAVLLCLSMSTAVDAAQPTLSRLEPLGVVRGQATKVILHGARIGDASSVLLDRPGLTVSDVKSLDNNKVEMTVTADATADPGLYPLQLVTKTGISNLRLLGVGAMPVVNEVEPNNDFDAAQKVALNSTLEGVIKFEDIDYFSVELQEGQTIHAEAEGIRLSYSMNNQIFDPYVAVLDEGKFEVSTSDDSSLLRQDALLAFKAPKTGVYRIVIRDSSFSGHDQAYYRLHIGTFPRPLAVIPAGQKPGELLTATLVHLTGSGSEMTTTQAQVQLPSQAVDRFPVVTQNDAGVSPSPNWIRVNELPVTVETEPNNEISKPNAAVSAAPDQPGAALCGVIETPGDIDFYSIACKKGQKVLVTVFARDTLRSPLDSVVNVYGPKNNGIAGNDDAGPKPDSYIEFTAAEDGLHTIRITDSLSRGGPSFAYRIEAALAKPKLTLDRRELARDEAVAAAVPRGGTMAVMVTAKRENFGGELKLELADLPPGITATTYPMSADRGEIPVILTAAADAPEGASLTRVIATTVDPKNPVTGELSLRHRLMLGQNRVDMWGYDSQRLAVSVAEAAPFKITLQQPGTPIVRSGSKELKVSIERNEGFDGEVFLSTLYNPPGIAVNNGRKIEKGQNEVMIPVTANGGAGIAVWPMAMIARYGTSQGQAHMVTPPVQLEVQDVQFKFTFPRIAAELGTETSVAVGVEVVRPFTGTCEVQLVGLPAGVTSSAATQPVTPETTSITFPLTITADAKVGTHKVLHCVATIRNDAGDIIQTQGTGELRIDQPLPPKPAAAAPAAAAAPEPPKPEVKAAAKPLSRLEQLRQMKNQ